VKKVQGGFRPISAHLVTIEDELQGDADPAREDFGHRRCSSATSGAMNKRSSPAPYSPGGGRRSCSGLEASLGIDTLPWRQSCFCPAVYLALALWIDRFEPEPRGLCARPVGRSVAILLRPHQHVFNLTIGNKSDGRHQRPVAENSEEGRLVLALLPQEEN